MVMMTDAAPAVEQVYNISEEFEQIETLKNQFSHLYEIIADYKYIAEARYEKEGELTRYLSGLPSVNFNAVMGWVQDFKDYDQRIVEQLQFFGKTPFFWYVDEKANPAFKEALKKHGFVDEGIFRGVVGSLETPITLTAVPEGCVLEMVQDEKTIEEFNDLVCRVFAIEEPTKTAYKEILWNLTQEKNRQWYHWVARQDGKVVSAVSTMIQDGIVSFWNGASTPELRKQGLSTALRRYSLQHAILNGAKWGSSYLMSEGLALGICTKLGYKTKWRFHAFVSPTDGVNTYP
jgi:hypothetical protein